MHELLNVWLQRMMHRSSCINSWIRCDWTDWEQRGQKLVKKKYFHKHTLKHTLDILVTAARGTSSHPFHEKIAWGSTSLSVSVLSYLLTFIHSSAFPVRSSPLLLLRDFQLQQVNKRQKILLIIAGTFHRCSGISTMSHCSQRETHSVSSSYLSCVQ